MEGLVPKFRDEVFAPDGSIKANIGDKIFIKCIIDQKEKVSSTNFYVWIKGKVETVKDNKVTIKDITILGKFQDKEKQTVCDGSFETLTNRFRGPKAFTLLKEGQWLIVPQKENSGINNIRFQEEISETLGLPDQDEEQEEEEMDVTTILATLNKVNTTKEKINELISFLALASGDDSFRVISADKILQVFQVQKPCEKSIKDRLYTINVLAELLGYSMDLKRASGKPAKHWSTANKQISQAYYSVLEQWLMIFKMILKLDEVSPPRPRKGSNSPQSG